MLPGQACSLQDPVCDSSPAQFCPPYAGAGLPQLLDWNTVPLQVAVQVPLSSHPLQLPSTKTHGSTFHTSATTFAGSILIPGQCCSLHAMVRCFGWFDGSQSSPPFAGAGLSQVDVCSKAPSQVAEQVPESTHSLHCP